MTFRKKRGALSTGQIEKGDGPDGESVMSQKGFCG